MESRQEIIEWISSLEERYPVNEWEVNKIHVWPIIKKTIYFSLVKEVDKLSKNVLPYTESSTAKRVYALIKSFFKVIAFLLRPLKVSVLFSGTYSHRVFYKDSFYNRYFDPMMDYLKGDGIKSLYVEYSDSGLTRHKFYKKDRVLFLSDFMPVIRLLSKFLNVKNKAYLKSYDLFLSELKRSEFLNQKVMDGLRKESLAKVVTSIQSYATFFSFVFFKTKARMAFGLCYYNNPMFGMNYAAFYSDVISIDMQHGTQGSLHFAYASWKKFPEAGYNLLPKIFWCWDESSHSIIEEWSVRGKNKSLVGGNPWLSEVQHYSSSIQFENVVLYTLQPLGELLDDYIINTIKSTKNIYSWWLRLHPRQVHQEDELIAILKSHGLDNVVNIHEASLLPLPYILRNSKVHISKFSGSIQESIMLATPTIIIHQIGQTAFKREIESGLALTCLEENSTALMDCIAKALVTDKRSEVLNTDPFRQLKGIINSFK